MVAEMFCLLVEVDLVLSASPAPSSRKAPIAYVGGRTERKTYTVGSFIPRALTSPGSSALRSV